MKPQLKPPGIKLLKLKCDVRLSTSAFKCKLRRYIVVCIELTDASALVPFSGDADTLVNVME